MMNPILQAPNVPLAADSNAVVNYQRDSRNYVTQLFGEQLPTIANGFFNVYLSKGNYCAAALAHQCHGDGCGHHR
ncbi:hypothetical protein Q0F98_00710 [Paenibacillus amylolyticus]|nr:hypothetical protein Q0F98_00710 [Paenibacillus amylolyticus]